MVRRIPCSPLDNLQKQKQLQLVEPNAKKSCVLLEQILHDPDLDPEPKKSRLIRAAELLVCRLIAVHTLFWSTIIVLVIKFQKLGRFRSTICEYTFICLWCYYAFKFIATAYFCHRGIEMLRCNIKHPVEWWRHQTKRRPPSSSSASSCQEDSASARHLMEFDDVLHVVVVAIYNETVPILQDTLNSLAAQSEDVVVVLAMEDRIDDAQERAAQLLLGYQQVFRNMYVTFHQLGDEEVAGKSSNVNWSVRCIKKKLVDVDGVETSRIVVTVCDADTILHSAYLSALSHAYCTSRDWSKSIWQGSIHFYPNMDKDAPNLCAVRYTMATAGFLGQFRNPFYFQLPFSCYSLSMDLILRAKYFNPAIISEDWHMYIRCFFATRGKARTVPLFLPAGCGCVAAETTFRTCMACFEQAIRWQWGASDLGYFVANSYQTIRVAPLATIRLFASIVDHHLMYPLIWLVNSAWIWVLAGSHVEYPILWWTFYVSTVAITVTMDVQFRHLLSMSRNLSLHRIICFALFPLADIFFQIIPTFIAHIKLALDPTNFKFTVSPKFIQDKVPNN